MVGGQQSRDARERRDDEIEDPAPVPTQANQSSGVDAVLDEIDEVLEQNAEQFVRGFVQKGGQ